MCVFLVLVCKSGEKRNWKDNVETPSEGRYSDGRSGSSWYRKPPNSKERIPRMTKANAPTQLCTWRPLELNCGAWLHLRPHQHDCLWIVARTSPALPRLEICQKIYTTGFSGRGRIHVYYKITNKFAMYRRQPDIGLRQYDCTGPGQVVGPTWRKIWYV